MTLGSDGSIAILSRAYYSGTNYGLHLTKLSPEGSILLSRVYHYTDISIYYSYTEAHPSGGFVLTGRGKFPPST